MMRYRFDMQLECLNSELIAMGQLCVGAIDKAAKALLGGNIQLAKAIVEADDEIDNKEREIESLCLKLLLQQQPVAKDLRQISAALKMITDMERIGDQAADISEIVCMANISAEVNKVRIAEMGKATIKMVTESIDAYVKKDLDLAQEIIEYDDIVDGLFDEVKRELINIIRQNPENGEYAIDLIMIAKYFERIGDHATNIAEWVEFSITGTHRRNIVTDSRD